MPPPRPIGYKWRSTIKKLRCPPASKKINQTSLPEKPAQTSVAMAKTIQDQLAEKIEAKFPTAEIKKVNKDNYVDIHLPGVHPKRGTHLFFNTAGGAIKLGFYCREEDFTQQVLAKNMSLEAYSQGIRPKGNPEWKTVDAACAAAISFVESLSGKATQNSPTTAAATGSGGSTLFQRIKATYPKCGVNEEKGYASFTYKAAFLYELRIQKGTIRLLAANYPQKASVAKSLALIAQHQLAEKSVQDRYPLLVEPGKVSPDKLTVRIEIPYQAGDLENEGFISQVIACCEQFHNTLMPLINGFQAQPVGMLEEIMSDGSTPKSSELEKEAAKKETPSATASEQGELSMFDLTEFDLEGRPIGMKDAPAATVQKGAENTEEDEFRFAEIMKMLDAQMESEEEEVKTPLPAGLKGKLADTSLADESDRCLHTPLHFLTCIQLFRNYYLGLSSESKDYRASYEETLLEFTEAAVVPRIKDEFLRTAHNGGNLSESLLLGTMQQAEQVYDENYATHNEYVSSLSEVIAELLPNCNTGLFLDTLELFMYLGDMLEEGDSPSGSLAPQDRYFPLFLMLKASPDQELDNLEMVLSKGAKSRNENSGCDVKSLVLKVSGNFGQLNNEEKLALMLYDFILWDEPNEGLDIKVGDIAAAKSIFQKVTQNAALGNQLLGGFDDNASFEIFQFFNVEFNREGFHEFCLARWEELSSEWNPLKLQLLLDHIKRDFHPNTYINNPVLNDYLEVYGGIKVADFSASTAPAKKEDQKEENEEPYIINPTKKTLYISSMPHCILFVLLQVGSKLDQFTEAEIADIQSTAVTMGEWFDMDQDECLEALDETFELLKKCKTIFNTEEMGDFVFENCLVINKDVPNEAVREDIIRYMNDLANADGKVTFVEKENLDYYATLIRIGSSMFG
jgi:hypothetical protein